MKNVKKTNRKNKTQQVVNWPTGFYTITSLTSMNPEFVRITLRVRLNNAVEDKTVSILGTLSGAQGRPKLVYANNPVSPETIESAKQAGVVLINETPSVINVVSVKKVEEPAAAEVSPIVTNTETVTA